MSNNKPCPFCGSPPTLEHWSSGGVMYGYRCSSTKHKVCCMGRGRSPEEAAEYWNRRAIRPDKPIKDCPFCGAEPKVYDWVNKQGEDRVIIECLCCNPRPQLLAETREEAINIWNKRV